MKLNIKNTGLEALFNAFGKDLNLDLYNLENTCKDYRERLKVKKIKAMYNLRLKFNMDLTFERRAAYIHLFIPEIPKGIIAQHLKNMEEKGVNLNLSYNDKEKFQSLLDDIKRNNESNSSAHLKIV